MMPPFKPETLNTPIAEIPEVGPGIPPMRITFTNRVDYSIPSSHRSIIYEETKSISGQDKRSVSSTHYQDNTERVNCREDSIRDYMPCNSIDVM
jgi:hypothetical protein